MEKILGNIVNTWWKISDFSLRNSCSSHTNTTYTWRWVVSSHNLKGINSDLATGEYVAIVVSTHNLKGINSIRNYNY